MNLVFYLFVFHEHESLPGTENYGEQQQTDGRNVTFKIHTSFIKNKICLPLPR